MNKYMVLDGKMYITVAKSWQSIFIKPMTVRTTLLGETDATYGSALITGWTGEIKAPVQADTGYGTIDDLMATLATMGPVSFTDHLGASCQVHANGPGSRRSLLTMWDSPSNAFYVQVNLTKVVAT